jgi:hypothetical protein
MPCTVQLTRLGEYAKYTGIFQRDNDVMAVYPRMMMVYDILGII